MIPLAIWWSTWKERNQRIFAGKAKSYQDFKLYCLRTLYSWSHVLGDGTYMKLLDFVDEISIESMRISGYFLVPLLYMGDIPLVSH